MTTILAIDYGQKKIGLAVGQMITQTAQPLDVIFIKGDFWLKINKIFKEWQPAAVVIGEPKLADDTPHPLEKLIESFIFELKKRYNVKIYRENEAFTSFEASQYHTGANYNKPVDAHAAAIILESWMRANHA
ncbi:Holliday junction resolvase RuvX [Ostreibacterium oceani]|nr:Holliday junction resolvase RuvX [Ostreibacterium oceani]